MGNLANFEAFKLNKVQMNEVKGGVKCTVDHGDGVVETYENKDLSLSEGLKAMNDAYGEVAVSISCSN